MATTSSPVAINPPSYQIIITTLNNRMPANRIKVFSFIAIAIAIIQIAVAAVGLSEPCPIGLYVLSFGHYGNSFWVAGPILLYALAIGCSVDRNNLTKNRIANMKIGAFLCVLCIIGGFVVLGLTIRALSILSVYSDHFHFDCGTHKVSVNEIYTPAVLTTTVHFGIYIFYFSFCVWIMRLNNDFYPNMFAARSSGRNTFVVQPPAEEIPSYEQCIAKSKILTKDGKLAAINVPQTAQA
ncbi:uncharacterized protein TRIADDRAFT_57759 [Trichoplax adhaerens]|uniref:Uncharacterized protein n=1 Tax=Trichoplax adhaerens TaxID=10228 RepID=B3S0C0_TRIAD|nr:predicted protein [Trichoplax adhaerens]EDV23987.1 predicted protein [Trichoplax adhaerens]|eukprot:XP_002113513.1 predicted protein [Trichoplax adhaerens]